SRTCPSTSTRASDPSASLGMQQPVSVLFNLLIGYMLILAWPRLKRAILENYYTRPFYLGYGIWASTPGLGRPPATPATGPAPETQLLFSRRAPIMYGLFSTVIRTIRRM
ncbi:hypothetical protein BGX33_001315, partial [Mortierella sp. NVP41]